jgi:hypothetical protein
VRQDSKKSLRDSQVSATGGLALLSEFLNFLHAYCVHAHATAMHRMKANGSMTTVTT